MPKQWDLLIIGGGASGMAAAVSAARNGENVLLLEKSSALGKKISASGNGRCNLMNISDPVYYGDPDFVLASFRSFSSTDLLDFWNDAGLFLTQEDAGRIYPRTLQASSVMDILKAHLRINHVEMILQSAVTAVRKENDLFVVSSSKGIFYSKRLLIATGGKAYPRLGGNDSGYSFLQSFGHHIITPVPALCPLCTDSKSISGLSGIRVRCKLSLINHQGKELFSTRGEVLFTDYGISGICAMQCARLIDGDGCTVHLDLADRIEQDNQSLYLTLIERHKRFSSLPPEYLLNGILVPRLSFAVLKQADISTAGRNAGDLSEDEIFRAARQLRMYTLHITGSRGFDEAQVTAGGADCVEFDPSTMESKIVKNLFASGEVLNVDGDCGGYNLMFAFISGILAGRNGLERKKDHQ